MSKYTMSDIRRINEESGFYFFDRDTMRFFGSRVYNYVYAGNVFITSEYTGFDRTTRGFTVRRFEEETGKIKEVSKFGQFKTLAAARDFAKSIAG